MGMKDDTFNSVVDGPKVVLVICLIAVTSGKLACVISILPLITDTFDRLNIKRIFRNVDICFDIFPSL